VVVEKTGAKQVKYDKIKNTLYTIYCELLCHSK